MLNKKQEIFCLEYLKHHRACDAYDAAGFQSKTQKAKNSAACRLLKKPAVQARIKELMGEMNKERVADVQECQEHLTEIIRDEGIKPFARIKAIEILLRAHGAFETNINVTSAIPVVISGGDSLEE